MAKWYGKVGYIVDTEVRPGVWQPSPTEKNYYGDLQTNVAKWSSSGKVNDDMDVANKISIMADPYAYQHFSRIRYVEIMDALWEVKTVEVQRPRLIIQVGGVYNGPTPTVVTE